MNLTEKVAMHHLKLDLDLYKKTDQVCLKLDLIDTMVKRLLELKSKIPANDI